MAKKKIIICGAAGRDFHNFNVVYRNNNEYEVVAFTATQIPDIEGRMYPPELAGSLYPNGIPIVDESELVALIKKHQVQEVVFAYSDVTHTHVMQLGSLAMAAGATYTLLSPVQTMIQSTKPVISICAVRTGCGKSQTTLAVAQILEKMGKKVVSIRHPMPYGNLVEMRCQRFATKADLARYKCTIEEMEEYEPHVESGRIIYAGVDYEEILRAAEKEADVILWDGGNNDTPFYKSDLEIVVVDPHRPNHELLYHPGMTNFVRADVLVINKMDSADKKNVAMIVANAKKFNPNAKIVKANSKLDIDEPKLIKGKKVLVVEDGPTLTHGEMKFGAGVVAAKKFKAKKLVDPRPWVVGTIKQTFKKYPNIGTLLPAMGYSSKQIKDLETTINKVVCDVVISATPIDLRRIVNIKKPTVRVKYSLQEISRPNLKQIIEAKLK
ncbi:MAG TPA: GTPase [Bdellovibrionales bacterium]|nr:MAG: GTPase [Bdellovibrionales bacterium GWB1_52_6]OFZ04274.1 MAG: GTPase [Bdellovibrionales bacterium GWA1_52_35]OFZ43527.1 MAG: GTPase [Bdellovibrionales bacterium GWC1_52_8]HAR43962.1 GTPase [Bdellovibrionales bacterium]HCM40879.1 GTPase [Bdellovibrionales bacterium]